MQCLVNILGLGMADAFDLFEILHARLTHGAYGAEMVEKPFLIGFADAGNVVQSGTQSSFASGLIW